MFEMTFNVIYNNFKMFIENESEYEKMSKASNLYGNGFASRKIADILAKYL